MEKRYYDYKKFREESLKNQLTTGIKNMKIPEINKQLMLEYMNECLANGLKISTTGNRIFPLRRLASFIQKDFREATKQDPVSVFEKAIQNVSPKMEVRPRRVGGASYQVPVEVRGDRKEALAIRWILQGARNRSNKEFHTFDKKLAQELMDAANNAGSAVKKRDDMQKVASANRAFAHFRW